MVNRRHASVASAAFSPLAAPTARGSEVGMTLASAKSGRRAAFRAQMRDGSAAEVEAFNASGLLPADTKLSLGRAGEPDQLLQCCACSKRTSFTADRYRDRPGPVRKIGRQLGFRIFGLAAGATAMLKVPRSTDRHSTLPTKPNASRTMRPPQHFGAAMLTSSFILAALAAFFAFVAALAELPRVELREELRPMIDK